MFVLEGFAFLVSCVALLSVQPSRGSEIIDGTEVVPHSLPYMAWLKNETTACGGTLISPSWVLSAAHCKGKNQVWLGVHNIQNPEYNSRQYRNVKAEIIHPGFDASAKDNDLMLFKLDKAVRETKTVKPFTLSDTMKEPPAGTECLVAGWGTTDYTVQKISYVLMSANVTLLGRDKCDALYHRTLSENVICAGKKGTNSAGTCKGDSGGPLVCNGALVGVTSFGSKKCGMPDRPAAYAFLSTKQLNWIKRMMKTL